LFIHVVIRRLAMKINTKIRKKVIEKILKRLNNKMDKLSPYGFEDPMDTYYLIEYWEDKLNDL